MMEWNHNIDEAPKGRLEERNIIVKGKKAVRNVFVAEPILIATPCRKVFISYMLKDGRWNFMSENEIPVAWMHKPKHPNA